MKMLRNECTFVCVARLTDSQVLFFVIYTSFQLLGRLAWPGTLFFSTSRKHVLSLNVMPVFRSKSSTGHRRVTCLWTVLKMTMTTSRYTWADWHFTDYNFAPVAFCKVNWSFYRPISIHIICLSLQYSLGSVCLRSCLSIVTYRHS